MHPKHFLLSLLVLLFLALASFFAMPSLAAPTAATISVNTAADEFGTGPDCSLREAIQSANTNADFGGCTHTGTYGDDTIVVPAGTYTITISVGGTEDLNTEGDLDISSSLTISGTGAGSRIIDGNGGTTGERVFHVTGAFTVTISGVTIKNGGGCLGDGGGIFNLFGSVTVMNSTISNNCAGFAGGGIYSGSGTMTVTNSSIYSNTATSNDGGGIYKFAGTMNVTSTMIYGNNAGGFAGGIINDTGTMTVTNSSIYSNTATSWGGGIRNGNGGTMTLNNSNVLTNTATNGSGILNDDGSTLVVHSCNIMSNTAASNGGGIYNDSSATLVLNGSSVNSNTSSGIGGGGVFNNGNMTVNNTTIGSPGNPNVSLSGGGGGIFNFSSGTLTVTNNSTISYNTANNDNGGGIDNINIANLSNSTISNNSGGNGGGVANSGTMTLTTMTISGNSAVFGVGGGGIYNSGVSSALVITNSSVSGNLATGSFQNGGGVLISGGTMTVTNSTINANQTTDINGSGGGIYVGIGTISLFNSTLSGNKTKVNGGGIYKPGGGTVNLNNVTVAINQADSDNFNGGAGGGLSGGENLKNTIIAGNLMGITPADCAGTLNTQGYNLIQNVSCTFVPTTGDQTGVDPKLGPLGNNGGSTKTHPLFFGSPAINAGNPGTPDGLSEHCMPTDQRGTARPVGAFCDIGAYEGTTYPLYLPLIEK